METYMTIVFFLALVMMAINAVCIIVGRNPGARALNFATMILNLITAMRLYMDYLR